MKKENKVFYWGLEGTVQFVRAKKSSECCWHETKPKRNNLPWEHTVSRTGFDHKICYFFSASLKKVFRVPLF